MGNLDKMPRSVEVRRRPSALGKRVIDAGYFISKTAEPNDLLLMMFPDAEDEM